MASLRSESIATSRLRAWFLTGFGFLALTLAVLGVYGVLSYAVAARRQEIAIRRAVGADRSQIETLLGWEGLRLVIGGQILGLALAFGISRVLGSLLFGISPNAPLPYLVASAAMGSSVLLASYLPARRAGRVDPAEVLRS